jgi:hypothetical protein
MAHTCRKDWEQCLTTLDKANDQTHIDISFITSSITNLNSRLASLKSLPTSITQLTAMCQQCQDAVNNLTVLFKLTPDPFSSSTSYNLDDPKSSESTYFPSNHFQQDLCPPHVEVNEFDGLDPTGWVTQMEHYFSLYDITHELAKLRYGVLHLDLKRWQWW